MDEKRNDRILGRLHPASGADTGQMPEGLRVPRTGLG